MYNFIVLAVGAENMEALGTVDYSIAVESGLKQSQRRDV